ncbi:hypothetical protein ABKN59_011370 [Abortiporus biennis]
MDWISMIVHGIRPHSEKFSTRSATGAEVKAIEELDIRYQKEWTKYLCRHCDEFLTFVDQATIESHLKQRHEISAEFLDHVIRSSDQDLRTQDYRLLISDKVDLGTNSEAKGAIAMGYGVVCNFAALRRSAAKSTNDSREKR